MAASLPGPLISGASSTSAPPTVIPLAHGTLLLGNAPQAGLSVVPLDLGALLGGANARGAAGSTSAQPALFFPITPWNGTALLPVPVTSPGPLLGFPGLVLNPGDADVAVEVRIGEHLDHVVVPPGQGAWLMAFARSEGTAVTHVESWAVEGTFVGGLGLRGTTDLRATDAGQALRWPAGPPPTGDKLAPHLAVVVHNLRGQDATFVTGSQAIGIALGTPTAPGPGEAIEVCNGWGNDGPGAVAPDPARSPCVPPAAYVGSTSYAMSLVPPLTTWYLIAYQGALPEVLALRSRTATTPGGVVLDAAVVERAEVTLP